MLTGFADGSRVVQVACDGIEYAGIGRRLRSPSPDDFDEPASKRARIDLYADSAIAIDCDEDEEPSSPSSSSFTDSGSPSSRSDSFSSTASQPALPPAAHLALVLPGPVSHPFWFDDGDLVVGVEDAFFCVHAYRLCAVSEAFRTALGLPDGGTVSMRPQAGVPGINDLGLRIVEFSGELVDGRPLVRLLDDRPSDWLVALEAMYDPS